MECFWGICARPKTEVDRNEQCSVHKGLPRSSGLSSCKCANTSSFMCNLFINSVEIRGSHNSTTCPSDMQTMEDLREVMRKKAEKHRSYFERLVGNDNTDLITSSPCKEVEPPITNATSDAAGELKNVNFRSDLIQGEKRIELRQRKTGVYELFKSSSVHSEDIIFKSVNQLKQNYMLMTEKSTQYLKNSNTPVPLTRTFNKEADDSLLLPPSSGYCSSVASAASDDEREKICSQKATVRRCGSSDSAIVQSDEEIHPVISNWGEKKEVIEIDEVGYKCPYSPYSPRGSIDHDNVPSKTLLEAQFVPLPVDRKLSDCASDSADFDVPSSRRESCFTDDGDETPRYRYWRTPSVVVSDYSDDIMGLTLEDLEYIRSQRKDHSSSPDSSLHSSCSNLNFCGSTISGLESDFIFRKPYRKLSVCSTCSTLSGDEETDYSPPAHNNEPSGWRKLRNIVQWTPFFQTSKNKKQYPWVQLAGHQGNFKAGPDQGTILKKLCTKEEKCFKVLMKDVLKPYVPEYKGLVVSDDGESSYIQLQDLLGDFTSPCVMDCKIGVRTYLEEELAKAKEKPKLRRDMYEKMCQIDEAAPTDEEHKLKGVTKPRYMVWRETISSTATLGFRIEGIRKADGTSSKDFKTTKTKDQIMEAFIDFTENFPHAVPKYIQRLKAIRSTLENSQFFNSHEVIGSSLLFVHDRYNANVWLIDFAKTVRLPDDVKINHNTKWKVGNHEDGYLIGINNLISIFKAMLEKLPVPVTPPLSLKEPPEIEKLERNEENS